jgi:predicted transcriptional regulator
MTARENELLGHSWDRHSILKALESGPKMRTELNLPGGKCTQLSRLNELIAMGKIERIWGQVYRLVEERI